MAANVHYHRYRSPPPMSRSIRFAPLPDPRRSPSPPDADPVSPISDDASSGSSSGSNPQKRISYPVEPYPVASTSLTPVSSNVAPISSEPDYVSLDTAPRTSLSKRSFLRPFFKKSTVAGTSSPASSMSLTPTPSIDTSQSKQASRRFHISAEDILTLGTIKLFRSVSRNNRYPSDNESPNEWELSRWTSAQSAPAPTLNNASIFGSSLSRSQSTKPPALSSRTSNGHKRRSGSNGGVSSASNIKPTSRKGVRMLNGRVYGAPKNPFDNVRDEADPEFVEWGYGGMGSVSGGRAAGMSGTRWERLQSGQSPDDPSLDDSSGMGWVKKRREARERRRAKEEGKTADSCDASAPNPDPEPRTPTPVANPEENSPRSSVHHPRPSPNITRPPSAASTSTPRSSYLIPSEGEHVLHAVTIPANFQHHHHHHHHHHHRTASKATLVSAGDDEVKPNTPSDHQESEESESEGEEPQDNEEEEESDSSGFGQSKRITALGAGVEKYTRHKESERDQNQLTVMSPVSE